MPSLLTHVLPSGHPLLQDRPRVYIVHLLPPESGRMLSGSEEVLEAWYKSFLPTPSLDCGKPRMVHSYTEVISGFAAWLTPREVEDMRAMDGFVGAQPDEPLTLDTTHTPTFLQLENGTGLWGSTKWGEGRLIGVIDFNIDPDHVSFAGVGMKPRPHWNGTCDFRCTSPATCSCTNKLLGARLFNLQPKADTDHGTMVASIAAGDFVAGAKDYKFLNYAKGNASGVSPKSYLSFYSAKVSNKFLAAIEQAIRDRVDVLSISQSLDTPAYHSNDLAIGTLRAVEKGIFVAMSAGNTGPRPMSVRNNAPWLLTVGASTHDRALEMILNTTDTATGVRKVHYGATQFDLDAIFTSNQRLVYPAGDGRGGHNVKTCNNTLGHEKNVQGAIRYNFTKRGAVKARFWPSKPVFNIRPCPVVAGFSSRGPSKEITGFLKPDILGPGVSILAARSGSRDEFKTVSGTSFATPHLAAIAALLKSRHPDWSPAAIRSAIMTTADIHGTRITNHTGKTASLYDMGAGLVNPTRADDPGLVYNITDTSVSSAVCTHSVR
ncbi:hypothetical protein Taro_047339 [Colocasia esculenta]|uniref:Uncharacterized protein n=1 Tax=Colocasia esculenta TaxID=4460 RepID=A0A843X3Q5_COLES|nr:hypothetical protein [Colocasia esculenta]